MRIFKPLQSYLLVTLIAALIWLYAEGQDVRSVTREIEVALPARIGQALVADFPDGTDQMRVTMTIKGATSQLGQLQARLGASGAVVLPVQLSATGRQTLSLLPLVSQMHVDEDKPGSPTIMDLGVSVVSVEPGEVPVVVDELVTKQVEVIFSPKGVQLGPNVKITPTQVPVTLPKSYADRLEGRPDALKVEAIISAGALSTMQEGVEQQNVQASLELRGPEWDKRVGRHIKLGVTTADVTFTIERQQDSLPVQLVPVWVTTPPSELRRYDVTLADESRVLREVTITGPRDLIEQLRSKPNEMRVIARFQLTGDMLDKGVSSAPLSSVEIQQIMPSGLGRLLQVVPVNPAALAGSGAGGANGGGASQPGGVPTFMSPSISIYAPTATVQFTVVKREQLAATP